MRHIQLDQWSRRESYLHARDPRAKIIALLLFLIVLATAPFGPGMFSYAGLLVIGISIARLPTGALEVRAAAILPFSLTFAAVTWLAGDPVRAALLVTRSYLSGLAVLLVVSTTPIPLLLRGLEKLGAPHLFVLVVQFLYRYLFVISGQAQHMRLAAACRQGLSQSPLRAKFQAAAGAVSVLFARSYSRAEGIHRAMLARGFQGVFPPGTDLHFGLPDLAFMLVAILALGVVRLASP